MKEDDLELVRGGGNVFRDFGRPNAELEQARAIIAAKIIRILDDRKLSTRDAGKLTGVSHSEFSRIRNTQLRRFTLDRMIAILGKLDADIEVSVTFRARKNGAHRRRARREFQLRCTHRLYLPRLKTMALSYNEGRACDAVVRVLEAREGRNRDNVRLPEQEHHGAPIELVCNIGDRLFALEHTGIEPFSGHMQMEAEADRLFRPIEAMLAGKLPSNDTLSWASL